MDLTLDEFQNLTTCLILKLIKLNTKLIKSDKQNQNDMRILI